MDKAGTSHYPCASHDMKDFSEFKPADELSQTEPAALGGIVWHKLDAWILPLCTVFYWLASLVCL